MVTAAEGVDVLAALTLLLLPPWSSAIVIPTQEDGKYGRWWVAALTTLRFQDDPGPQTQAGPDASLRPGPRQWRRRAGQKERTS